MTAYNYLYIMMIGLAALLATRVDAATEASLDAAPAGLAPDGTPVVHKSFHKKTASLVVNPTATAPLPTSSSVTGTTSPALGPTVETGLPVAKHGAADVYTPLPAGKSALGSTTHQQMIASAFPLGGATTAMGTFSTPRTTSAADNFTFANFPKKTKNVYPWRSNIITTMFYIGEGGSAISSTDNVASAWDENWRATNRGSDNPNDRSGYGPADHAATVNTFYVALPFNDLAFPDKAHRWLPAGWHRPDKDGKQVSACQHRWVEIKNSQGRICYAQWEDVGPLNYADAEYVFGGQRPVGLGDHRAGLDVSPAVAQYLSINNTAVTSWRFVDDEDVPPGAWLRYDELALLYQAMHQQKSTPPPIQRASQPIDDPEKVDSNKKQVGAAKG